MPRVCVAITGSDPTELIEKADFLARDNTFLEFRLDYFSQPALALPKIKQFTEYIPMLRRSQLVDELTRRQVQRIVASQLDVSNKAIAAGCQLIDLELQTAVKCKPSQLKSCARAGLVLSFHDFKRQRGWKKL